MLAVTFTLPSVKVVCAVPDASPVAVTAYSAMNESGSWNSSLIEPPASALTSDSRSQVCPTLSLTVMWTCSPGSQLSPVRTTVSPGA